MQLLLNWLVHILFSCIYSSELVNFFTPRPNIQQMCKPPTEIYGTIMLQPNYCFRMKDSIGHLLSTWYT